MGFCLAWGGRAEHSRIGVHRGGGQLSGPCYRDNGYVAEPVLITIRVHPGASRARVGGFHTEPGRGRSDGLVPVLGVWVSQRAVDGKATEAALAALANALGVRLRSVRLIAGERSRVKVIEVSDPPADLSERLASLAS
jgi:uncharacterized protein YggU (UPF0235/DUF167 family)